MLDILSIKGGGGTLIWGGAWGSVVSRNSKFSSWIFAVAYVRISARMFSVKWH